MSLNELTPAEHDARVEHAYDEYRAASRAGAPAEIIDELRRKWWERCEARFDSIIEALPPANTFEAEPLEAIVTPAPHPAFMLGTGAVTGAALVFLGALIAQWIA